MAMDSIRHFKPTGNCFDSDKYKCPKCGVGRVDGPYIDTIGDGVVYLMMFYSCGTSLRIRRKGPCYDTVNWVESRECLENRGIETKGMRYLNGRK